MCYCPPHGELKSTVFICDTFVQVLVFVPFPSSPQALSLPLTLTQATFDEDDHLLDELNNIKLFQAKLDKDNHQLPKLNKENQPQAKLIEGNHP